jgi:hypothetical protein
MGGNKTRATVTRGQFFRGLNGKFMRLDVAHLRLPAPGLSPFVSPHHLIRYGML